MIDFRTAMAHARGAKQSELFSASVALMNFIVVAADDGCKASN